MSNALPNISIKSASEVPAVSSELLKNKKMLAANNKHSNKISWYRRNALDMVDAIDTHLIDKYAVYLPSTWQEFKATRSHVMDYDSYGDEMDLELSQLVKLRYDLLRSGKAVYAVFEGNGVPIKTQMLSCWYSKHRLDPVWNYRKSQLIRKIYRDYLLKSNIHMQYHPCHLVLTVPHKDGKFMDKEFYVKEITRCFNQLRKTDTWKEYVYGGEYGVEVKSSARGNGLHIHIHSLVFQHKQYTVNEVREALAIEWKAITDAEFIHYETLYHYKKDEFGHTIKDTKLVYDQQEKQWKKVEARKKFYINRKDGPTDPEEILSEYLYGVMECIKYHFKNDSIENKDGSYNVDLMIDVVNNTKGVRLYSRFGAFYKVQELNFNRLEKPVEEQSDNDVEEEVMASTDNVMHNLINPHTGEKAEPGEYIFCISKPECIRHHGKKSLTPHEPEIHNKNNLYEIREGMSLKNIMKSMVQGKIWEILLERDLLRYHEHHHQAQAQYKLKFVFSDN